MRVNLTIDQGATFQHVFYWQDGDGNAIDLTGWTARMQIRDDYDAAATLADLTSAAGDITITAAEGKVSVEMSAVETAGLPDGKAVYDLEIEDGATGFVERLAWGYAVITPEVTR